MLSSSRRTREVRALNVERLLDVYEEGNDYCLVDDDDDDLVDNDDDDDRDDVDNGDDNNENVSSDR